MSMRSLSRLDLNAPLARILILVLGALLLWFVFVTSYAGVYRFTDPAAALRVAPRDSYAMAELAAAASLDLEQVGGRKAARAQAQAALSRDLTNVVALRTLGVLAELDGDRDAAFRLINLAEKVSRRDLPSQLWLIEHFSQGDDVAQTLRHYDIALTTSLKSRETLLPILVSASADPAIGAALRPLVAKRPDWRQEFVNLLIASGPVEGGANVLGGLLDTRDVSERTNLSGLLYRLSISQKTDVAWRLYIQAKAQAGKKVDGLLIRNGDFETPDELAPFDWVLQDDNDSSATRAARPDGEGTALFLSAAHETAATVATQTLKLPPGKFRLSFEMGSVPQRVGDRPSVIIICLGGKGLGDLVRAVPGKAFEGAQQVSDDFSVGPNCPWQSLIIKVNSGSGDSGARPWIDNVTITPLAS